MLIKMITLAARSDTYIWCLGILNFIVPYYSVFNTVAWKWKPNHDYKYPPPPIIGMLELKWLYFSIPAYHSLIRILTNKNNLLAEERKKNGAWKIIIAIISFMYRPRSSIFHLVTKLKWDATFERQVDLWLRHLIPLLWYPGPGTHSRPQIIWLNCAEFKNQRAHEYDNSIWTADVISNYGLGENGNLLRNFHRVIALQWIASIPRWVSALYIVLK